MGGIPSIITECEDIYVLPHADPHQWPQLQKDSLYNFVNSGGWLFSGCHAVSAIENTVASNGTKLNFLSSSGLVLWQNHSNDPSPPYSYRVHGS